MTVKNNKTTMINEYINNNLDVLINSNKTLEELCEDFNKNNNKKVSFSSFYNVFKDVTKEKGLIKKRIRRTKEEIKNKKEPMTPPEAQNEEITKPNIRLNNLNDFDKLRINNPTKIYGIERYLNKYQAQTFEISKDYPNNKNYNLIVDMNKSFSINNLLYAPVVCILSKSNIHTNEEYNELFKTSHPKKQTKYINVIRMKQGTYEHKFYVVNYWGDDRYIMPFCKTSYKEFADIKELIKYYEEKEETEEETEETEEETEETEYETVD